MENKDIGSDYGSGDLDLFTFFDRPCSGRDFCDMYDLNYNTVKRRISRDLHCQDESKRFYCSNDIGFVMSERDFRYPDSYKSKCKHFSNRFAKALIKERHKELRFEFNPLVLRGNLVSSLSDLHYYINNYKRYFGNPVDEKYFKRKINKHLDIIKESFDTMFMFYEESLGFIEDVRVDDKFDDNDLNDFLFVNDWLKKVKGKRKK